jgi:hypothetical protein
MASEYKHNYVAFRVEILKAPFMIEEMGARVERGKAAAIASAPVDEKSRHPGRYKASFEAEVTTRLHNRATGVLSNTSPEAGFVEFGTKNNPARYVLTRAMEAMR